MKTAMSTVIYPMKTATFCYLIPMIIAKTHRGRVQWNVISSLS